MAAANIPDESKGPSVTSMDRIHLKVSSLGASGLPDTEGALMAMMKNLQDPYLILRVGNIEHRTSTVSDPLNTKTLLVYWLIEIWGCPLVGSDGLAAGGQWW